MGALNQVEAPTKISIEKVSLDFEVGSSRERLKVLEDVDLQVQVGEFVCLIGPSGCGKSTLLMCVGGHLAPRQGSISVDGHPIMGPGPDRAIVFQQPTLFPWLTVHQNVSYGLRLAANHHLRTQASERVQRLLEMIGLQDFAERFPHELSGGMRQRVEIARALAVEPDILLMDEPFGALDALTRLHMQNEMLRIWSQTKKTVLFVTHDIMEALILADQILVFSPRPAKVLEICRVDSERPRDRADPRLSQMAKHIARLLGTTL